MDARRTLMLLVLCLGLALLASCAPDGWPREAAAGPTPGEPTGEIPYPPPPTATPAPTDPVSGYPVAPTRTGRPSSTPTATLTPPVTPTEIPFPTPIPTPVVTQVPVAEPPLIPEAAGRAPEVFTLVYRAGDTVRAVQSDGTGDRVLLDVPRDTPPGSSGRDGGMYIWQKEDLSPDGRFLALVVDGDIHLFDLETREARVLVERAGEPAWSPDGTRLAYRDSSTGGLWVVEAATGKAWEVYAVEQPEGGLRFVMYLSWSPDGMRICFLDETLFEERALVVVNADGSGHVVLLTSRSIYGAPPVWSPRGDLIVFAQDEARRYPSGVLTELWSIRPDGSSPTQLTHDFVARAPQWSPDGRWIAFTGFAPFERLDIRADVWLIDPEGGDLIRLTATEDIDEYAFAWSPDGLMLVVRGTRGPDMSDHAVWSLSLIDGARSLLIPDIEPASWLHALRP